MLIEFNGQRPRIGANVFIAPTAVVIGDVTIGDHSSIWYGAVLRGDEDAITIGSHSNIQDNCTIHVDQGVPATIGDYVTIGHNAVVHGCTIADWSLIGINAVVLNHARIESGSIVAAGAVVTEGQTVGPDHLVAGAPAKLKRQLDAAVKPRLQTSIDNYLRLSGEHGQDRIIDR